MKFAKAPVFRLIYASFLALSFTFTAGAHASALRTARLTTSDGTTYTYDFVPAMPDHPTVLLLHGFPSTRQDWRYQMKDLTAAGYGIIAPDMLGYGDSDRPTELEAYRLKRMSGHLNELLNHENINSVVGVGHDWGTMVLSKSLYWHPERFDKAAFLSTGYTPVGTFWDVDAANAASWEYFGYSQYGYWYFFNSYNAADLMEERIESAFSLLYHRNTSAWAQDFANIGAARTWLTANTTTSLPEFITEDIREDWFAAFGRKGAFSASLNCYQSLMRGTQADDEKDVSNEGKKLRIPVLSVGGLRDQVARYEQLHETIRPWATGTHTIRDLDTGHWMLYEDPEGVSSLLLDFLKTDGSL